MSIAQAPALATPTVSVEVLPRIGLFHELQYRRDPADRPDLVQGQPNWRPMDAAAFMQAVHERTRSLLKAATGGHWELLTTQAPHAGYGTRRARVVVTDTRTPTACRAELAGRLFTGQVADGACTALVELTTNNTATLSVSVRHGNEPEVQLPASVPQDYLIVVMGDSYASGEGTPDRPCNEVRGFWGSLGPCDRGPALWMDQQCHRSFWSAGMRTALDLMERERRTRGFTVVNVACSGARVDAGLLDEYEGVATVADMVKRHGADLGVSGAGATGHPVRSQLDVVRDVLAAEAARGGKAAADLMILSAGGNDIKFGEVVLRSLSGARDDAWVSDVENNLGRRLGFYEERLKHLADRLVAISSDLTLWVPYPDVTDINDPRKLDVTCASGATQFALFNDDSEKLLSINSRERALAWRILVERLNAINTDFAGRQRFHLLDRAAIDDQFRHRGWCGDAHNKSAYRTGGRLIRKADESWAYQRNASGTMHPTSEAHEFFFGLIKRTLDRARREELNIELAAVAPGAGSWTRSPVQVGLTPAARAFAGAHEICDSQAPLASCRAGSYEVAVEHGQRLARPLVAVHGVTRRWFRRQLPEHTVDARPPQHAGCVLERARGGDPVDCEQLWVLPGDSLRFLAQDEGSGLAGVTVAQRTVGGDFVVPATAQPGGARVRVADLPSGVLQLVAVATDRVGLTATQTYAVRVDRQPPAIPRLRVHGADLVASQFARLLPAPGGALDLGVLAADADSGVVAIEARVGVTPIALTGHDEVVSRLDACRRASVAAAPHEKTLRVETPGTVQVVLTAYDCGRQPGTPVTLNVTHLPRHAGPVLPPHQWAARPTAALRQLVQRMTRLFIAAPSADDAQAHGIHALWLNIADGRLDPAQELPLVIQPGSCELRAGPGDASTLYAALLAAESCSAGALASDPQGRNHLFDAILQAFAATQG